MFVLLHTKNQSSDLQDLHFSGSYTIFLTFILQWLPTCAVWFYVGEASRDYLQPIFTTSSQLFDHKAMAGQPGLHPVLHLVSTMTLGDADVSDVWKDVSRNFTDVSETIAFMDLLNTFWLIPSSHQLKFTACLPFSLKVIQVPRRKGETWIGRNKCKAAQRRIKKPSSLLEGILIINFPNHSYGPAALTISVQVVEVRNRRLEKGC